MGCCSNFNDKYQECKLLIEELKLIIFQSFTGKYTENEIKTLNKYKYEKEDKIRDILDKLQKESTDEIEKRKIEKLKEEFYDVIDDDDNSHSICNIINSSNNEENENEEIDSTSSISMELETNLNLNELPSDDESLRFIDKVFDIKSNIKPIRNDLKSVIYPPLMPQTKEKFVKVEPIKIEKPIDYKSKNEEIVEKIEIIKKEINDKNSKIEEIKNKKNIIEKKEKMIREALKKSLIKIEIIKEEIACLKKQIDDLLANNKKGQYFRKLSINNIINNRNYCIFENNENNSIYDKETFRK